MAVELWDLREERPPRELRAGAVKRVACGSGGLAVLLQDGTLWRAGEGPCGLDSLADGPVWWRQAEVGEAVVDVALHHTLLAVTVRGRVWSGETVGGPVVPIGTHVVSVSCGRAHALVQGMGGDVVVLADAVRSSDSSPGLHVVPVPGLTRVGAIAA